MRKRPKHQGPHGWPGVRFRVPQPPGQGEDPQIALGVTVKEPPAPSSEAPEDEDRDDNRKALNLAKEALRKAESKDATIDELRNITRELIGRLPTATPNGEPQPKDEKPPYSAKEIEEFAKADDWASVTEATEENQKWYQEQALEQSRSVAREEVGQVTRQDRLKGYLLKELGLTGLSDEERNLIVKEKSFLMSEYGLDEATAEVTARGVVNQRYRKGDVELPDLRDQSRDLDKTPATAETSPPAKIEVDWNAPNRGLSMEMAQKLRSWGLEKVLTPSEDRRLEEEYRGIVLDLMRDEQRRRGR